MKKIILALALGLAIPQAHASKEFCSSIADLMLIVTQSRDDGDTLTKVKQDIEKSVLPPNLKKLVSGMSEGVFYNEKFQAMTPRQVATLTYKVCMKAEEK